MKLLFSTGSLHYLPLEQVFSLAQETGFDGCELVAGPNIGDSAFLERVFRCGEAFPVCSLHAPYTRIPAWGNNIEALARAVTVARRLGARVVNFHPPSWFSMELQFLKWFRRVQDFQRELQCEEIFLTVENMPRVGRKLMLSPFFLNDMNDLIDFGMARNLYFTFDTTHCASFHDDVVAAFIRFFSTGRLKNVHFSDYGDSKEHLFPGRGEVPVVKLLNVIRRLGYDGMITLELSPHEWPKNEEWLRRLMKYAVSFMKFNLGLS